MERTGLSARLAIQIVIGLMSAAGEEDELVLLVAKARLIGLTGAEIGAATRGQSFDVRDAEAMALSRAYRDGVSAAINLQEIKAIDAGLSDNEMRSIKDLVDNPLTALDQ